MIRALARWIEPYAHVESASRWTDAKARIDEHAIDGLVTDIKLPDGNGIDLIPLSRATGRRVPARVITGHLEGWIPEQVNRVSDMADAKLYFKPMEGGRMLELVLATYAPQPTFADVLDRFLDEQPGFDKLCPREVSSIRWLLCGLDRDEIATKRGLKGEKSVERDIASGIQKLSFDRASELLRAFLRLLSGR